MWTEALALAPDGYVVRSPHPKVYLTNTTHGGLQQAPPYQPSEDSVVSPLTVWDSWDRSPDEDGIPCADSKGETHSPVLSPDHSGTGGSGLDKSLNVAK